MRLTGRLPQGRTQAHWFAEGYQAAMRDIQRALTEGGPDAVADWVKNNTLEYAKGQGR